MSYFHKKNKLFTFVVSCVFASKTEAGCNYPFLYIMIFTKPFVSISGLSITMSHWNSSKLNILSFGLHYILRSAPQGHLKVDYAVNVKAWMFVLLLCCHSFKVTAESLWQALLPFLFTVLYVLQLAQWWCWWFFCGGRPGYEGILLTHRVEPVFLMSTNSKEGPFIIAFSEFYICCALITDLFEWRSSQFEDSLLCCWCNECTSFWVSITVSLSAFLNVAVCCCFLWPLACIHIPSREGKEKERNEVLQSSIIRGVWRQPMMTCKCIKATAVRNINSRDTILWLFSWCMKSCVCLFMEVVA